MAYIVDSNITKDPPLRSLVELTSAVRCHVGLASKGSSKWDSPRSEERRIIWFAGAATIEAKMSESTTSNEWDPLEWLRWRTPWLFGCVGQPLPWGVRQSGQRSRRL